MLRVRATRCCCHQGVGTWLVVLLLLISRQRHCMLLLRSQGHVVMVVLEATHLLLLTGWGSTNSSKCTSIAERVMQYSTR